MKLNFQVEYILVKFDDENKTAQVSLRAEDVLAKLNEKEMADPNGNFSLKLTICKRSLCNCSLLICRCKILVAPRVRSLYGNYEFFLIKFSIPILFSFIG